MKPKEAKILLVPIGAVSADLLGWLAQTAHPVVHRQFVIAKSIPVPREGFDTQRKQFQGEALLKALTRLDANGFERVVGLIDADCYTPGLNFIFGQASPTEGVAVVALPRLRQSYYHLPEDQELFQERTLKEVIHELGHTWNLEHCLDPYCVMHFSNSLTDTDVKRHQFCALCQAKLKLH